MYNFSNDKALEQPFSNQAAFLPKNIIYYAKNYSYFTTCRIFPLKIFRSLNNYMFLCRKKII